MRESVKVERRIEEEELEGEENLELRSLRGD